MALKCGHRGCSLPVDHFGVDCEPTHAGKVTYWGERALVLRNSMERDGLSLDEIGRIFGGAAPTLRPPPMPLDVEDKVAVYEAKHATVTALRVAEIISPEMASGMRAQLNRELAIACDFPRPDGLDELESRDVSSDLKPRGGNL